MDQSTTFYQAPTGAMELTPFASLDAAEPGLLYTHRHLTDPGLLLRPQEAAR